MKRNGLVILYLSRKTRYKWKNRYKEKGVKGLSDLSTRPHNIKYRKATSEIQETILDLRLTKRFGVIGSSLD
jgi:transposase